MIKFDKEYNIEQYTLILSRRNHRHIGAIRNVSGLVSKENLNAANEIAFVVNKYNDPENKKDIEKYWDDITDFKFVYVKELDEYYEVTVELSDDQDGEYKSITGTSACECELSQIYIHGLEINTELDIAREEYKDPTVFYKPENIKESLLHRILSVAPHYSIKYVDDSLKNIQRTFSCDGEDVYSFLTGEVAEEIKCLFLFDTTDRSISVYDLQTVCLDCGHRGEYDDVCPKCNSCNLKVYGEDTTIYVDTENLAENITFTTDTPSVKNCFKLEAGDDNMTAAVINNNPNGSPYIYYFSREQKNDMSTELVDKLDEYDKLYDSYTEEYSKIILDIYDCIDKIVYYTSEMMPTIGHEETDAKKEAAKLNEQNLSPIGLSTVSSSTSTATVNSALKNYAKVYVHSGKYKIDVNQGEFSYEGEDSEGYNYGYWYGNFTVTNWGDEEDTAISEEIRVLVRDNYQEFLEQKIEKKLANENDEEGSIFDVLSIKDLNAFKNALTYYGLNRLTSFFDAIQGVIDILIEEDQASPGADMYEPLYLPYKNKLDATQVEIDKRSATIKSYKDKYETLEKRQLEIQKTLNFQDFLGNDLFIEFCLYRREDVYSNPNYISDGFENDEIFKRANEFLEVAKSELVKSGEHQHTITSTLLNLLAMKEFRPLVDKFKLGNFIRVGIDKNKYRLRLISYQITFDDTTNIDVEFSDLLKIKDSSSDLENILNQASSMASTYDYVVNQVDSSQKQTNITKNWLKDGLDLTNIKIMSSATNQSVVYDKNGLLVRSVDDINNGYLPEQLKIVNSTIAITDDNWKTVKTAVGKFHYIDPLSGEQKTAYGINSEVLIGNLLIGQGLIIKTQDDSFVIDDRGLNINTTSKTTNKQLFSISKDGAKKLYMDANGNIVGNDMTINNLTANNGYFSGKIDVTSGTIKGLTIEGNTIRGNTISGGSISGTTVSGGTISGAAIKGGSLNINNVCTIDENGRLVCTNASVTGTITSKNGTIGSLAITTDGFSYNGTRNIIWYGFGYAVPTRIKQTIQVPNSVDGAGFRIEAVQVNSSGQPASDELITEIYADGFFTTGVVDCYSLTYFEISQNSDRRLKKNIIEMDDKLIDVWKDLQQCQFEYNDIIKSDDKKHFGLIAQDVIGAFEKHGLNYKDYGFVGERYNQRDKNTYYQLDYMYYHMMTAKVLKNALDKIDVLEQELKELKGAKGNEIK